MPRLSPVDPEDASPEARALFEQDRAVFGQVLNTTRVAARRPKIAAAAKALGKAVAEDSLIPAQLRLLLNVRIASLVGCPF